MVEGGSLGRDLEPDDLREGDRRRRRLRRALPSSLARGRTSAVAIFDALAIEDIRGACDVLRPVYERTRRASTARVDRGPPDLAHDTTTTLDEARRLCARGRAAERDGQDPGDRRGPARDPGGARRGHQHQHHADLLARALRAGDGGVPRGPRAPRRRGRPIDDVASVASFFVSRVDTQVDGADRRDAGRAPGERRAAASTALQRQGGDRATRGSRTRASATCSRRRASRRWRRRARRVQRPLWARPARRTRRTRDMCTSRS